MFRTLKANEIECRVSQIQSNWLSLLLYKNARVDMDILDEEIGIMNWKKDYQLIDGQLFCTISIWDKDKEQWISKQDVGVESFSQEEKGRASDAQKRSAFCFGIGRELYSSPSIFITPSKEMIPKGKDSEFFCKNPDEKDDSKKRYDTKTRFYVSYIDYDENKKIKDLEIRDNKGNQRFSHLTKETEKYFLKISQDLTKLINSVEENDEKFDREKFYEYFDVKNDSQMTNEQKLEGIELLKKMIKGEKNE